MFEDLKKLFFTATGRDTGVIFLGTLVNVLVGGLFFVLAPRILGPANYGIFALVMSTGLMATNFANFGIDTGILKFLKTNVNEENDRILKLALKAYLTIGAAVFIVGFLLSDTIANVLGISTYANLLRIAFAGVIFILLTNFFVAVLQANKKFLESSFVNISSNMARLLLLGAAAYFATVDLYFLTALFFFVTIVSVVVGKLFVPLDFLKAKDENLHLKDFFTYNFWIAASLAISAIPIDNFLIIKYAGPLATGLYAAPMKILTTTYQFAGSYSRVLASRMSSFDTNQKVVEFSKKAAVLVMVIFVGLLVVGMFSNIFVKVFLGSQYEQSIPLFKLLSVGMAFFFADTIPMSILLYYFGKSKVAFYITVWHYAIYTALLFVLISKYAELGASIAFALSEIITFLTLTSYVVLKLNEKRS